jgi:hypothetical protein
LIYWGATRWNTKWDAMERVHKLHTSINAAMAHDKAQDAYHLNDEEVRSMAVVLPFLKSMCEATDRFVPTRVVDLYSFMHGSGCNEMTALSVRCTPCKPWFLVISMPTSETLSWVPWLQLESKPWQST